jgi:hypothetical protein
MECDEVSPRELHCNETGIRDQSPTVSQKKFCVCVHLFTENVGAKRSGASLFLKNGLKILESKVERMKGKKLRKNFE